MWFRAVWLRAVWVRAVGVRAVGVGRSPTKKMDFGSKDGDRVTQCEACSLPRLAHGLHETSSGPS